MYEAAHYPAMFDCIAPRYRSAATGCIGCMAFLLGSPAPAVLGWMGERFSARTGFMSLCAFYAAGLAILVAALVFFFRRDYVGEKNDA